jgi:hypothetical protein
VQAVHGNAGGPRKQRPAIASRIMDLTVTPDAIWGYSAENSNYKLRIVRAGHLPSR